MRGVLGSSVSGSEVEELQKLQKEGKRNKMMAEANEIAKRSQLKEFVGLAEDLVKGAEENRVWGKADAREVRRMLRDLESGKLSYGQFWRRVEYDYKYENEKASYPYQINIK